MKRKKITIIALVLAMMFMLSGCIQMVLELDLKEDMSAEFDMKLGILKEYSEMMEDMWADYDEISKLGYTVAPYEKDGYTGMEVTGKVRDITKKNDVSEYFLNEGKEIFIAYKEDGGKKLVTLNLPVNSFYGDTESEEAGMSLEELNSYAKADIRLVVTFPFDVVEHNATDVSGRTLTWDISEMTDSNMYAVAEGVATSVGSKILKGVLLGLGAIAIAGIVILILSKAGKKKRANNIANATSNTGEQVYDYNANNANDTVNANQSMDASTYDKVNAETAEDNPFEG